MGPTLVALVLFSSNPISQGINLPPKIQDAYETIKTLEEDMTHLKFQGLDIDVKDKTITYPFQESRLYFKIDKDHNGKPLYHLKYNFYLKNVQTYIKKLQRIAQGRTNQKTKDYSKKHQNSSSSIRHRLRNRNIY